MEPLSQNEQQEHDQKRSHVGITGNNRFSDNGHIVSSTVSFSLVIPSIIGAFIA